MLYMIFGGSGSGKSAYAEDLAVKLCPEEKVYLATLTDIDEEMEQRIRDHRKMREGKSFRTVEQGLALETLDLPGDAGPGAAGEDRGGPGGIPRARDGGQAGPGALQLQRAQLH